MMPEICTSILLYNLFASQLHNTQYMFQQLAQLIKKRFLPMTFVLSMIWHEGKYHYQLWRIYA